MKGSGPVKKVAIVAALLILAACSSKSTAAPKTKYPPKFALSGDLRLSGAKNLTGNLSLCVGIGSFADLRAGAPVVLTGPTGAALARGVIRYGTGTDAYKGLLDECTFRFVAYNVPRKQKYQITIGQQPPQTLTLPLIFARANTPIQLNANPPNVTPTTAPTG